MVNIFLSLHGLQSHLVQYLCLPEMETGFLVFDILLSVFYAFQDTEISQKPRTTKEGKDDRQLPS